MPVRVTPEQFADKHARRLSAAIEDIRTGVARVTVSPTEQAAAKADKMLARLSDAVRTGKWAAGLRRVSLEEWKRQTTEKGIPRISAGITAARSKVVAFGRELLSYQNNLLTTVERLPDLTLEDSINRMTTWVRGMAQFKRTE